MPVLNDITVLELGGIGPVPLCGMLLADMGARVIRVDKLGGNPLAVPGDPTQRHRESIALNLRAPESIAALKAIIEKADVLLEGFRPGVLEKMGLSPDELTQLNPRLVVGRMTGWGQTGPRASTAGHDLNYLALSGVLHAMGAKDRVPAPPLNMVADYGGGAMFLAVGVLGALLERHQSGQGQVIDVSMSDGVATLGAVFYAMQAHGLWSESRQSNLLDGAAPFYRTYETSDNRFIAVGCIEPKFYQIFLDKLGVNQDALPGQYNRNQWDELSEILATRIKSETLQYWTSLYDGTDACVSPVLTLSEAPTDAHYQARGTFTDVGGNQQPHGMPRFSRTPNRQPAPAPKLGEHGAQLLLEFGVHDDDVDALKRNGSLRQPS